MFLFNNTKKSLLLATLISMAKLIKLPAGQAKYDNCNSINISFYKKSDFCKNFYLY